MKCFVLHYRQLSLDKLVQVKCMKCDSFNDHFFIIFLKYCTLGANCADEIMSYCARIFANVQRQPDTFHDMEQIWG